MSTLENDNFDEAVSLFDKIASVTADIQRDISVAMMSNEAKRDELGAHLKMSEEEMQRIMDKAVLTFLAAMPLASMNQSNLFTQAMAYHSNLTGNPMMHRIVDELNRRALQAN